MECFISLIFVSTLFIFILLSLIYNTYYFFPHILYVLCLLFAIHIISNFF